MPSTSQNRTKCQCEEDTEPTERPTSRRRMGTSGTMMDLDSDSGETDPQLKKKPCTTCRKSNRCDPRLGNVCLMRKLCTTCGNNAL